MNDYEYFFNSLEDEFLDKKYYNGTYYNYNGIGVPRVSDILRLLSNNADALMNWSNSLGFQRLSYKETLALAADRGTAIHEACENYIISGTLPDYSMCDDSISSVVFNAFEGFKSYWDWINRKYDIEIVEVEKILVCPYFGGTSDVLLKIDGKVWLWDFKSSNQVSYKHYVQLAAYKYMLENYYGIVIDGGVSILKLNKKKKETKEYSLSFGIENNVIYMNYCLDLFMSTMYTYYNQLRVTHDFNDTVLKVI